jgi:hypothetical protein
LNGFLSRLNISIKLLGNILILLIRIRITSRSITLARRGVVVRVLVFILLPVFALRLAAVAAAIVRAVPVALAASAGGAVAIY